MSLKITAREQTAIKISELNDDFSTVNIEYKFPGSDFDTYYGDPIEIFEGEEVEFKNYSGTFSHSDGSVKFKLESTGKIDVSGDLASMLQGDWEQTGQRPQLSENTQSFANFFEDCPIVDASGLSLKFELIGIDDAMFSLFGGCFDLEKGPNLDVDYIRVESCYSYMFSNCMNLREITFGYSNLDSSLVENWMIGAGTQGGTLYYTNPNFSTSSISWGSNSGLPNGWTARPQIVEPDEYFRLTSRYDNNIIQLASNGYNEVSLEYRTDLNAGWQTYSLGTQLTLFANSWIELRNGTGHFSNSDSRISISSTREVDASGELYTLLNYTRDPYADGTFYADPYAFASLFNGCDVVDADNLKLFPRNSIHIYDLMFANCTNLQKTPLIDFSIATDTGSYSGMFSGCTGLVNVNSTVGGQSFAESACESMFANCTNLQSFSGFVIQGLNNSSFANMFIGCTNLTEVYNCAISQTATSAFYNMFKNCSKLTVVPSFVGTKDLQMKESCFNGMFEGCTSLTEIPELMSTNLSNGCYARMFAGCTGITKATMFDATRQPNCYKEMFSGCINLNTVTWKSKAIPSATYCKDWLSNVAASGTFEYLWPLLDVASIPRSSDGVPASWSMHVLNAQSGPVMKINNVYIDKVVISGKNIAKLFINGVKVKSSSAIGTDIELPSQYTKLQYVDTNGGYIDTGIPTNGDLKVGIKWSKTKSGDSKWPELFGNQTLLGYSGDHYKGFTLRCSTTTGHYEYCHGIYSNTVPRYGARIEIEEASAELGPQVHEYWMDPTNFSFDGQVFNIIDYTIEHDPDHATDWEFQPSRLNKQNMRLFSSYTSGRNAIINCYNFYIVDTSTGMVLLNYIPCKLGSVVGFYDSVMQSFITHNSFKAGPEA